MMIVDRLSGNLVSLLRNRGKDFFEKKYLKAEKATDFEVRYWTKHMRRDIGIIDQSINANNHMRLSGIF